MLQGQLTGSRIRERRLDLGMKQAELASRAGISASYLNLIEHNRRRIGGKILNELARALRVDPSSLTEGTEKAVLDMLRTAAAAQQGVAVEMDRLEEFSSRTPGWASLVSAQAQNIERLEARVKALTDRLAHDPQLASSLHEVITAVTSIRSTSSILVSGEGIDRDWEARFHRNIYEDSQRLADSSRALVLYLDAPAEDGGAPLSPNEEIEAVLEKRPDILRQIERGADPEIPHLRSKPAQKMMRAQLDRFESDVALLPHGAFEKEAVAADYNPETLSRTFSVPLDVVLRRLAMLSTEDGHPTFALAICDRAGVTTYLKGAQAVGLTRTGAPCPLWPLYQALGAAGRPVKQMVALPGNDGAQMMCYAVALTRGAASFDGPQLVEGVMLMRQMDEVSEGAAFPVGPGCRICQRAECAARREPSILSEIEDSRQTF